MTLHSVPFFDSRRCPQPSRAEILDAISRVYNSGTLILGDEVKRFERDFAAYCGCNHAVGVANGTDAIMLLLHAVGIRSGDEVIVPAQSASATAMAVLMTGARVVFCDVDPVALTIDVDGCRRLVTERTKAIVAVHLYGRSAEIDPLLELCGEGGPHLIEDCAQAHGTRYRGRPVGSFGAGGCFSFYPTKNLGALGDGGAVVTDDPEVADRLLQLRQYGWTTRFRSDSLGYNSRLDEIQAAILNVRLRHLDYYVSERRRIAKLYIQQLADLNLTLPSFCDGDSFHLFVVRSRRRDELRHALLKNGIQSGVHYPWALSEQPAFACAVNYGSCPAAQLSATEVLSLPLFPGLSEDEVEYVCRTLRQASRSKDVTQE